jgi:hypothetical protein
VQGVEIVHDSIREHPKSDTDKGPGFGGFYKYEVVKIVV